MKRRTAIRSLAALPAFSAIPGFAQQSATDQTKPPQQTKLPPELQPAPVPDVPKLAMTQADTVSGSETAFFTSTQLATLRRLASLLVPAAGGRPGALEAGVPEFLDFLIGQSPASRQKLYRDGLDKLEAQARAASGQSFAATGTAQAEALLQPLKAGARDGSFLAAAKEDVLRATLNSREWAAASTQRRGSGVGTYWFALD